ncbi:MAG: DUF2127 domain-containing protein [Myxococcota bacterium]
MTARPAALKAIITWKVARAAVSLLGALVAWVLVASGQTSALQAWVQAVHDHAASALALRVTALVLPALEPKHLEVAIGALVVDGLSLLVEGWGLWRGARWAPWLVVGLTALLMPFEVHALVQHPSAPRVLVLLGNAVIVWWLVRHARRLR